MSILIFGSLQDPHVGALYWALSTVGHECAVLDYSAYPVDWQTSCSIAESGCVQTMSRLPSLAATLIHEQFDTVWNRRARPVGHFPDLAVAEVEIARTISRLHLDNMRAVARAGQTWVNPRQKQREIDNKIAQLQLAADLGLRIPRTLVSNDPAEVRGFVRSCGSAVVKPITPMYWNIDGRVRAMATRDVTQAHLRRDGALVGCPMIYQEKVDKLFELRITFFGDEFVCARLDSQAHHGSKTDFRTLDPANLALEEVPLEPELRSRLELFRRRAGLLHGSFDLAVNTEGSPIFFEVNEQGQFLWLEEVNPGIRMLDRLVSFMETPRDDFRWDGAERFAFSEWEAQETGCS